MNDQQDHGLFHEIEDELQHKRLMAFWGKYGTLIIVACLALILGTAASSGWRSYKLNQEQTASESLLNLLEGTEKKDNKVAAFEEFVKENGTATQAVLSRFFAAQTAMDQGKRERAIAFYDALAVDADVEPIFRGLADILSVMAQFDTNEPKDLAQRLQPLLKDSPWRDFAQELVGHLAVKIGDNEKAEVMFTDILNRKDVSPGVQSRAADMARWLAEKKGKIVSTGNSK